MTIAVVDGRRGPSLPNGVIDSTGGQGLQP